MSNEQNTNILNEDRFLLLPDLALILALPGGLFKSPIWDPSWEYLV